MLPAGVLGLMLWAIAGVAQAAGDAAAGQQKSTACAACHGVDGNNPLDLYPKIGGQNSRYLLKQMLDIQSGARPIPEMAGQLDAMQKADLEDIAAYYAAQETHYGKADAEVVERGELIYRGGLKEDHIPACAACHSPTGRGIPSAGFPALGGQHARYIRQQLMRFQQAERDNDPNRMMRDISHRLSEEDIAAVASYISGLHE